MEAIVIFRTAKLVLFAWLLSSVYAAVTYPQQSFPLYEVLGLPNLEQQQAQPFYTPSPRYHSDDETQYFIWNSMNEIRALKNDLWQTRKDFIETKEHLLHELKELRERIVDELKEDLDEIKEHISHELKETLLLDTKREVLREVRQELKQTKEDIHREVKHELKETKEEILREVEHELRELDRDVSELKHKLNERTRPIHNREKLPGSCADLWETGNVMNGLYMVADRHTVKTVFCEFKKRYEEDHDHHEVAAKDGDHDHEFREREIGRVDIKSRPVYFHVSRDEEFSIEHKRIPFEREIINRGDAMEKHKGVFTAPVSGKYFFAFTGMAKLALKRDENVRIKIAMFWHKEREDGEERTEVAMSYYDAPPIHSRDSLAVTSVVAKQEPEDLPEVEGSNRRRNYVRMTNSFEVTLQLKKRDKIFLEIEDIDRHCEMEDITLTGFLLEEDIDSRDDLEDLF